MYFGAGVEGKPAGSQSNKVVRGCFAGCKFGPRGLSLSHPLSTPFSSIVRCASRPLTLLESVHELPGHTKSSTDVFPPSNVVYRSTSLLFFFFNLRSESVSSPFFRIDGRIGGNSFNPFVFFCSNVTVTELLTVEIFFKFS